MRPRHATVVYALALAAACSLLLGGSAPVKLPSMQKNAVVDYKKLDINQLSCVIGSDGTYADYLQANVAGMEWPKGSGKTCVYTAGLWIAGIHRPTQQIRTSVQFYYSEEQPGPFLSGEIFNTTTDNDSAWDLRTADPRYRCYKVAKDFPGGDPAQQIDPWTSWPGDLGAPFIDNNGNGVWDSTVDVPKFAGDEMIWCVVNDCSVARHQYLGLSQPLGLEIQELFYAFDQPGDLGNTMFMKWKIINKSDADYDSFCLGEWSDVDLGDGDDDLPGSDSTLSLGYMYNGGDTDATYGAAPPADGFVHLEGPKVPAGPGDSALVDGEWIKGFRNLPLSGIVSPRKNGPYAEPFTSDTLFAKIIYGFLRGRNGRTDSLLISPTTGQPTTFWLSGDPVSGTGDLPNNFGENVGHGFPFSIPQDNRIMNDCGPFTLARGDTEEIVGAFVIARGSSNLNSITALRSAAKVVREFFLNGGIVDVKGPQLKAVPARFGLEQNHPNPFNPATTIEYTIGGVPALSGAHLSGVEGPTPTNVKLVVYDVLGREVATLVNEIKQPGSYSVTFDGSRLASGVYYYRLQVRPLDSAIGRDSKSGAGSFTETRKMVLIK